MVVLAIAGAAIAPPAGLQSRPSQQIQAFALVSPDHENRFENMPGAQ
jgi:hypothetical protein